MKTVEMTEATAALAEYKRQVVLEPIVVTVKEKPVAAKITWTISQAHLLD